jgi:hypothetical protein
MMRLRECRCRSDAGEAAVEGEPRARTLDFRPLGHCKEVFRLRSSEIPPSFVSLRAPSLATLTRLISRQASGNVRRRLADIERQRRLPDLSGRRL